MLFSSILSFNYFSVVLSCYF